MTDKKSSDSRKAIIGAAVMPVAVPNAAISISKLFNATAAMPFFDVALWSFSAVVSVGVIGVGIYFICRHLARALPSWRRQDTDLPHRHVSGPKMK